MASSPMHWDQLTHGYSIWQSREAQKSEALQANLENLQVLIENHTGVNAQDPCNIERFAFHDVDRGADDIQQLESVANHHRLALEQQTHNTMDIIEFSAEVVQALELQEFASVVNRKRDAAEQEVQLASELLGQIVTNDAQKRRGRDDVLVDVFGASVIQGCQDDAKNSMYKQVRMDRIDQRMHTAIDAAWGLCDDHEWRPKLVEAKRITDSIKEQTGLSVVTHSQALETKAQVQTILDNLNLARQAGFQQLHECREEKRQAAHKLNNKRHALQAALQLLKDANDEYNDSFIENEALRIQVRKLENRIQDVGARLEAAVSVSGDALTACEHWHQSVLECEQQIADHVEAKSVACIQSIMVPKKAITFNITLARQLLVNVDRDCALQINSIDAELAAKSQTEQQLQIQMVAEEPDEDREVLELQLAKLKDEKQSLRDRLAQARQRKTQVQTYAEQAQLTWSSLQEFDDNAGMQEHERMLARSMADNMYHDFKLYVKGKPRPTVSSLSSGNGTSSCSSQDFHPLSDATDLVAIDQGTKAWIERLIDERTQVQTQAKFEQLRADLLYRNAPSTAAASELSDEWEIAGDIDTHA